MRKIVVTEAQKARAAAIVRQAEADGRTPNPATVALAKGDTEALTAIAENLRPIRPVQAKTRNKINN